MKEKFNEQISIAKAIGIITVVIGHTSAPITLCMFISSFHMPLFFYLSGYFFKETNITEYKKYFVKKVQGIYWQYLKWVLPMLWLHNIFYKIGIYSQLGGASFVTQKEIIIRTCTNILFMNGSDTLPGGTWFLKDLFYGSMFICSIAWVIKTFKKIKFHIIMLITSIGCFLLAYISSFENIYIKYLSWIFSSDMFLAASMIAFGYIFREFIVKYIPTKGIQAIFIFTLSFIILWLFSTHREGLNIFRSYQHMPSFALSSLIGLIMTISLSGYLNNYNNKIIQLLRYIGKHTITIYLMHFICFKLVNILIIIIYKLDYQFLGLPIIKEGYHHAWIIYTFCGIFLPLLLFRIWELYYSKYNIDAKVYPIINRILSRNKSKS